MGNLQPAVQRPWYSDAFTRQEPFALNFRWLVRVWCLLNTFSACSNRITEPLSCFCSFFIKLSIAFLAQFSSSSPENTHISCCLSRWFIESCKQGDGSVPQVAAHFAHILDIWYEIDLRGANSAMDVYCLDSCATAARKNTESRSIRSTVSMYRISHSDRPRGIIRLDPPCFSSDLPSIYRFIVFCQFQPLFSCCACARTYVACPVLC